MNHQQKNKEKRGLIFSIKQNSLDDGPGIRSVVFFSGCPLSCIWCHNPEGKNFSRLISHDPNKCIGCKTCTQVCPLNAISPDNKFFIDRNTCDLCGACQEECPSGAIEITGRWYSVPEVIDLLVQDKPFYDTSGGGVTLSGGEATLQADFAGKLAQGLKEHEIDILLETCGEFETSGFLSRLYPYIDTIYFDIKLMDPQEHEQWCGRTNKRILSNLETLIENEKNHGPRLEVRLPLVPGITDTRKNIGDIASWLLDRGKKRIKLLAYHPFWIEKLAKLGMEIPDLPDPLKKPLSREAVDNAVRLFNSSGIHAEP